MSPVDRSLDFGSWYRKIVMSKKKVIDERILKDCLPSLPLNLNKEIKKENQTYREFFLQKLSNDFPDYY